MFTNKKTIIFITKSKVTIAQVSVGNKPSENIITTVDYTPGLMSEALLKYKKNIKNPIRILLSEDFVYTVNITLPSGQTSRDHVKKAAQELIPENLDETIWDFKKIGLANTIQVVAASKVIIDALKIAIAKVGLQPEAIEPLSFALARFSKQDSKPIIYVYRYDSGVVIILAQTGSVISTEHLQNIDLDQLNEFLTFSERFSGRVEKVIFCGNTAGIDLASLENAKFKAQVLNISPIISLAYKEDIKGKDEEVLNLLFPESLPHPNPLPKGEGGEQTSMTKNVKKQNFSKTTIFAVFLLIAIGILLALILFKVYL